MTVLITGGFGYIGSRVAQTLAANGFEVILGTRKAPVSIPIWLPAAKLALLDWSSPSSLRFACAGVETVVHLAAMNEIESARDPVGALLTNGVATLNLLEAAIASRVKRFVYMSTAHVYGAPLQGRIDERTLPRAQHPYAITHKVAEDFVLAAHDQGKIEGLVLRLSNGFGAPSHADIDRWSLVVNDLCRQAVVSGALRLKSAGLQSRDFITLQDVGRAVVHCMSLSTESISDGLYNLGGDCVMRIVDMADLIRARWQSMTGICLPIERLEATANELLNEPLSRSLVYSSAKFQATGFSLLSQLEAEIDATLELCRHSFGAADFV